MLYVNVWVFGNNCFLDTVSPDVLILTESWLDSCIPDSLLVANYSYHIFRKNRLSRGVGILVLVKKLLNVSVREVTIPNKYCDTEIVAIDLSDDSEVMHFWLIAVYSSSDNATFSSALSDLADSISQVCVFGDFNLPLFN